MTLGITPVRDDTKSLDYCEVICQLLRDFNRVRSVMTTKEYTLTCRKIRKRYSLEGLSFLTKTLPRLGKALDRALSSDDAFELPLGFQKAEKAIFPKFLGEIFARVFSTHGRILPCPCIHSIAFLRTLLFHFYKLKLEYSRATELRVLKGFIQADEELKSVIIHGDALTKSRRLLARVFCNFDVRNIVPGHGPGAVSEGFRPDEKFCWDSIPARTSDMYPIDAYYYANLGHVSTSLDRLRSIGSDEPSARVILVPKDSRGPRLISAEPASLQFLQQGIMRSMVDWIENSPIVARQVNFTDQEPNRLAALDGSYTRDTVTLDLKEASDRVSMQLIRALWPSDLLEALEATRSKQTQLPNELVVRLNKFAPMGSALCFPVMAMTIWALLRPLVGEGNTLLVYGDDVIVPSAYADEAIATLESVGLKVNRDKSCLGGNFRESCGMDAYNGNPVTPLRCKTPWTSSPAAGSFSSWIAYCNQLWEENYCETATYVATRLIAIYGDLPTDGSVNYPSFVFPVVGRDTSIRTRSNRRLHRREVYVLVEEPVKVVSSMREDDRLFQYFLDEHRLDVVSPCGLLIRRRKEAADTTLVVRSVRSAGWYTKRKASKLVRRWRPMLSH